MTTDLLGDPIPETPSMTDPLPWRVWQVNTVTEYVMARGEREAIAAYLEWCEQCGDHRTEAELRADGMIDALHEMTDAELEAHTYIDLEEYDEKSGKHVRRTFAAELADQARTARVPKYFAGSEY